MVKVTDQQKKILNDYYFNISNPAAYAGPEKLFRVLNEKYPNVFTKSAIAAWLTSVDAYSVSKTPRRRFKTSRILVTRIHEQLEIDLTSVENLTKYNDGIRFLLFVIDVFTRFLWVRPLKDKRGQTILTALRPIISNLKVDKIRSDKGSEFVNTLVQSYLKKQGIYFFTASSPVHASIVERVQLTFKRRLFRYLRYKRSYRYIDDLQNLVKNYNATPHRSLNYVAPKDVNRDNEADLWAYMYLTKKGRKLPKQIAPFRFKVNDYVRISYLRHPFRKSYEQQFTTEIFKIRKRWRIQGYPVYKLSSWDGKELIKGNFNEADLTLVDASATENLFYIEKIIKKRKINGKLHYLVKWEGYPSSMNSYVLASDIKTMK